MGMIAITDGRVLTMDADRGEIPVGTVLIEDDQIMAVGPADGIEVPSNATVIDAAGKAVLPGFVNAHTHVPQILLRGGPSHDRDLYDWLFNVLYPGLDAYGPGDGGTGTLLYACEALRAGITTVVANEDFRPADFLSAADEVLPAFERSGLRVNYARMLFDHPREELAGVLASTMAKEPGVRHVDGLASTDQMLGQLDDLISKYHGTAEGRIAVWPAPSIPYLVSDIAMRRAKELAAANGTMWTMHTAEDPVEVGLHGMSTVEHLHRNRYLDDRLLAGHCVHITSRDIRLLAANGVKVSTQPGSNAYLAAGVAPVPEMLTAGVTVGIGTDDANCNDAVNPLGDAKALALLHRAVTRDASVITPETILEMMTIKGAAAVGMADRIGSLEVGKQADVTIIDLQRANLVPAHDLAAALVFQANGSEVETVIVDGRVRLLEGRLTFLDDGEEQRLLATAAEASTRICRDAGIEPTRPWRTVGR